uniref:Uncharacterized protein n=1 Tax=Anguilla anguilla TaxID=7936 RepID=A0A0E9P6T4_ANGAN
MPEEINSYTVLVFVNCAFSIANRQFWLTFNFADKDSRALFALFVSSCL